MSFQLPINRIRQRGGALILVLFILAVVASLVFYVQSLQHRRQLELQALQAELDLRRELLLLLREAGEVLAADTNLLVDVVSEPWARPQEGITTNGFSFYYTITDAQARFDVNNLTLPEELSPTRRPEAILSDLLALAGYFSEEQAVEALRDWIDADGEGIREKEWYQENDELRQPVNRPLYSLQELGAFSGQSARWMRPRPQTSTRERDYEANFPEHVTVLPLERRKPIPLNMNTATPEVLRAVLGEENREWVTTILQTRGNGPLQNMRPFLAAMPQRLAAVARQWLSVNSSFFELNLSLYRDSYSRTLRALFYRDNEGKVEILQCQW